MSNIFRKQGVNTGSGGSSDSSEDIEAIVNVYGAKNLLVYPYYETTKTQNGITFTDNGDGTVTVSGVSQEFTNMYLRSGTSNTFSSSNLILSGCPDGGGISTYRLVAKILNNDGTFYANISNTGGDTAFQLPTGKKIGNVSIEIMDANVDISTPITFKPMIRDARISDDTFVPYAMTNKELTDEVAQLNSKTAKNIKIVNVSNVTGTYSSDGYLDVTVTTTNISLGTMCMLGAICRGMNSGVCYGVSLLLVTGAHTFILRLRGTPNSFINQGVFAVSMIEGNEIDEQITI